MKKISDITFRILDSKHLLNRAVSIRFSYRSEIQNFKKIIDEAKPDIFVVANDLGLSATFIRICRLRGIPSVAIQDGLLTNRYSKGSLRFIAWKRYFPWQLISTITNIPIISNLTIRLGRQWEMPAWGTGGASVIAAMGDYSKRVFISRGFNPDRIFVTGSPLFDHLSERIPAIEADSEIGQFKALSNKHIVLLITQPFVEDGTWRPEHRTFYIKSAVDAVKRIDAMLIIKVHPREKLEIYQEILGSQDQNIIVTKDLDLDKLIESSDAIITISSTVGLTAIVHKKPLVVMSCFPLAAENVLEDLAIVVNDFFELPEILRKIFKNKQLRLKIVEKGNRSILDHLYRLDGNSSKRIAKLILFIAKKG